MTDSFIMFIIIFNSKISHNNARSFEAKLERILYLFFFVSFFLHFFLLLILLLNHTKSFSLLTLFLYFLLKQFSPRAVDWPWNPRLYFSSRHALHSKYLKSNTVTTINSIRHSFDVLVMLTLCVLNHRVNWWKLFGTFGTTKMFSLLMMMQNNLVFEVLLTVKTERS